MRQEIEEKRLQECTFKPKVSSRPPSPARGGRVQQPNVPVHDRLYQKQLAWEEKRCALPLSFSVV